MKRNLFFFLLSLSLIGVAGAAEVVPGEYIIKLKKGVSPKSFFSNSRVQSMVNKTKRLRVRNTQIYRVKVNSNVKVATVKKLMSHPMIDFIEPNYILEVPRTKRSRAYSLRELPKDDMFNQLWGLHNEEDTDINVVPAWDKTKGRREVVIAVVDTGIDLEHPDLKENLWVNEAEANGKPGVDDDNNGYVDDIHGYDFIDQDSTPEDGHSHGTHCAGTIGAVHDSLGVAGVVKNATLMASKIFNADGRTTTAAIVEAITYSADNGAHVMSNSWGGGGASQAIKGAIEYANSKGSIFVAAAGNNGTDNDKRPHYPSNYEIDNIIAVAAYQKNGRGASFTCYGKKSVDVAAPGVNILSTVLDGKYASYSGTSMATPHVSGVVGLILAMNPEWLGKKGDKKLVKVDPKKIRDLLISTSTKTDELKDISVSGGRVDVDKALETILRR